MLLSRIEKRISALQRQAARNGKRREQVNLDRKVSCSMKTIRFENRITESENQGAQAPLEEAQSGKPGLEASFSHF